MVVDLIPSLTRLFATLQTLLFNFLHGIAGVHCPQVCSSFFEKKKKKNLLGWVWLMRIKFSGQNLVHVIRPVQHLVG
jgi:hypothetical protein